MIVVADTSPINYLLLIKEIDILPKMYGTVVIPRAVQEELLRPVAPEIVRAWVGGAPAWLEIRSPIDAPDSSLANLDPGERDAIMLATELRADQLIVDDREGRKRAEERRIPVKNNEARLISYISYEMGTVTVLAVLTHKEYDKGGWKNACNC